jgi:predicted metal-dependent hydrolase
MVVSLASRRTAIQRAEGRHPGVRGLWIGHLMELRSEIPYRIRRSERARRVRVTVDGAGEVEVVLPVRAAERRAAEAVRELRPWIERRRRSAARAAAEVARPPGTVPYLGEHLRLVPQRGRTRVHRRGDELLVPAGDPREALERWYRRQARVEIAARLAVATARAGTRHTRLTIRGQKTRWGSCSASGAMSFNWRLLLAPPAVLDYVVEHEVCHLEVMDHSERFWRLLGSRVPDWRRSAGWLRRYGATLVL